MSTLAQLAKDLAAEIPEEELAKLLVPQGVIEELPPFQMTLTPDAHEYIERDRFHANFQIIEVLGNKLADFVKKQGIDPQKLEEIRRGRGSCRQLR